MLFNVKLGYSRPAAWNRCYRQCQVLKCWLHLLAAKAFDIVYSIFSWSDGSLLFSTFRLSCLVHLAPSTFLTNDGVKTILSLNIPSGEVMLVPPKPFESVSSQYLLTISPAPPIQFHKKPSCLVGMMPQCQAFEVPSWQTCFSLSLYVCVCVIYSVCVCVCVSPPLPKTNIAP